MVRFEAVRPAAVVLCGSPEDVAAVIAFARGLGLQTAIRSGGHSVAGRSSTEGLVIDVTPMCAVSVADGVATVGAGVRLGGLYDALHEHGLTIPAGCGPSVGIAGLTLGGGIGILGRKHGLTCDQLLGAQVVMADGRVVDCDEHDDAACSGRSAAPAPATSASSRPSSFAPCPRWRRRSSTWSGPLAHARRVDRGVAGLGPTAPDELDATLRLSAVGDGERPPRGRSSSAPWWQRSRRRRAARRARRRAGRTRHRPLATRVLPRGEAVPRRPRSGGRVGRGALRPRRRRGPLFTKSEFFWRSLAADTIGALAENLSSALAPGESREVTSCPGAARTTAWTPTPPPSFTATSCSWSNTWLVIDPDAAPPNATPPATG